MALKIEAYHGILERDGTLSKLFIYPSPHVLSEAEQVLLEYLDQPKSTTASKCKNYIEIIIDISLMRY